MKANPNRSVPKPAVRIRMGFSVRVAPQSLLHPALSEILKEETKDLCGIRELFLALAVLGLKTKSDAAVTLSKPRLRELQDQQQSLRFRVSIPSRSLLFPVLTSSKPIKENGQLGLLLVALAEKGLARGLAHPEIHQLFEHSLPQLQANQQAKVSVEETPKIRTRIQAMEG